MQNSFIELEQYTMSGVTQQLNVDTDEVEELLIGLILEGRIEGRIDQVAMRLELEPQYAFRRTERLFRFLTWSSTGTASRGSATALCINGRRRSSLFTLL